MGCFKRVEGEGANSKTLVLFKCEAECFIADSGSRGQNQDCSLLKVFLAKYLGREAEFVLFLVVGLSASLIAPTVMPLSFCVFDCLFLRCLFRRAVVLAFL